MKVDIQPYPSQNNPEKYTNQSFVYKINHESGASFSVINYGAIITQINLPDKRGQWADVELGHKDLDAYMASHAWHGASVGRSANRIAGASFELEHHIKIIIHLLPNPAIPGFGRESSFWVSVYYCWPVSSI